MTRKVVAGPFKTQTSLAEKLGLSQQYVNRQLKNNKFLFNLNRQKVIAKRVTEFVAGKTEANTKEDLAIKLGVSPDVVNKVFKKKTSGVIQTPKGKVKIQRLKPGEKQFHFSQTPL